MDRAFSRPPLENPDLMRFFAPCPRGLEALLVIELSTLGAQYVKPTAGGATFSCDWPTAIRCNVWSRLASRILWEQAQGGYRNETDIYALAAGVDWPTRFAASRTIRVDTVASKSPLRSLDFVTLKVKDAVCDVFRERVGARPSVDKSGDFRIQVYLTDHVCTIYLDLSGEPLFRRGFAHEARREIGEAPLKANLAAGILQLAGWNPALPLYDPMCGSGTFLIEAAAMARGVAPGLYRDFAFEKLLDYNPSVLADARAKVPGPVYDQPPQLFGSDISGDAVEMTRRNLAYSGLGALVGLKQGNFVELKPPVMVKDGVPGIVVANPPYGERLAGRGGSDMPVDEDGLSGLYPQWGDALKKHFAGWNAYFLSGDARLSKLIRLAASKRTVLFNGDIECRLFEYKMVTGSARRPE
jgi:putative N6-adenine-specific DNA methylase